MTLFQKKLNYLFKTLNIEERKFIEYFSEKEHNYSARKKVVINKWLYGEMKKLPKWKYNKYPISREKIDKTLVFPESCFLNEESVEDFENRVDMYLMNKLHSNIKKSSFEYKYIYYFNSKIKEILQLELTITNQISEHLYSVRLEPSSLYKKEGIDTYTGKLIEENNYYYIAVKNSHERVTFYFEIDSAFLHTQIYGLSLELSAVNGLPIARTRVLSTKELNEKEKKELYLFLNENETLMYNKNFNRYKNKNERYFYKFYEKIDNLKSFIEHSENLFKEELKDNAYYNIFYSIFDSFYEMSTNVKQNKRYWTSNKRQVYKKFLESMTREKDNTCYIVTPLYDSYIYLFDEYSSNLVEYNIQLSKQGLKIEQIFVLSKEYQLNKFIQKMVKKLISNNIIVRFVLLDDITKLSSLYSYDFLCSSKDDNTAIYRKNFGYIYYISRSKNKILKLKFDYTKIKNLSHPLDEFLIYQKKEKTILKELVGIWYHYYYGSYKNSNGLLRVWSSTLEIFENGVVEYRDEDKVTLKGELNCEFNKEHPFIYLTALESKSLALLQLDRQDIYRQIFKVPVLDKQLSSTLNMASVGFFSKEKMEESTIRDILGKDTGVLIEDSQMQERINNYYNQKKFGEE